MGTESAVIAKLDLEYHDNGEMKETIATAFTKELNNFQGLTPNNFDSVDDFELMFTARCPISLKFTMSTDNSGHHKINEIKDVTPFT